MRPDAQLLQGDDSTNPEKPIAYDENVQFTVFRPKAVMPERWHSLLAFAHLDELPEGSNQPDPIEEVERQAAAILGPLQERYKQTVQDSSQAVPKEGELTFVPEITGCEFNPPRQVIRWVESVHKVEFRLRASLSQDGKMVRGRMSIFLGAILLAEIPLRISVDSRHQDQMDGGPNEATHVIPYRKIFASYSHQDRAIVNQFEKYATTLGDRYLRDVQDLRSGENWDERLLTMIEEADVFQLFWSRNSMASPYVQREWRHAISLVHKGPYFVRPTYWQQPLPEDPSNDLPPAELRKRHFTCLHPEMEITPAAKDYEQRFFSRASENASEKMDVEISPDWVNQGLKLLLGIHGCPAEQSHVVLQLVDDCAFGSSSEVERIYREARKGVGLRLMQVTPRQLRSQRDWVYFQLETRGPEWDDVLKTRKLALRLPKRIVAFQQGSSHQQSLSVPAEHKMLELKIALFALMP